MRVGREAPYREENRSSSCRNEPDPRAVGEGSPVYPAIVKPSCKDEGRRRRPRIRARVRPYPKTPNQDKERQE